MLGLILLLPVEGAFALTQISRAGLWSRRQGRHNTALGGGSVTTLSRTKAVFLAALLCTFTFTAYLYEELLSNHSFPQSVEKQIYGNGKCHLTGVCKT